MDYRRDPRLPAWVHDGDDKGFFTFGMQTMMNAQNMLAEASAERHAKAARPWSEWSTVDRLWAWASLALMAFLPVFFVLAILFGHWS